MKAFQAIAISLLAGFVAWCGYLASQTDSDKVQREIDQSPMVAPNAMHRVQVPCYPKCGDDVQTGEYIAKLNSEWPIRKVDRISDLQLARLDRTDEEWRVINARTQSHAQMRALYNVHE